MSGLALPQAERCARAMGSSLHLVATGDPTITLGLLDWAVNRIGELEQRWSRFIGTSEVSRLNASPGSAQKVSKDTVTLFARALEARELSEGRFDPTMLAALQANGYDRTFVQITTPVGLPALDLRTSGFGSGIRVDVHSSTVTLEPGTGFDPGGIGKGLAADLVAEEMIARGATGAMVNLGGDVRCVGEGPADGAWVIAVGDDAAGVKNQVLEIAQGGVATSTRHRRRWTRLTKNGPVEAHHLLNPTTGQPADDAAALATVVAGSCADAEWLATAIASEGSLPTRRSILGDVAVMLTDHTGQYTTFGDPERFLR